MADFRIEAFELRASSGLRIHAGFKSSYHVSGCTHTHTYIRTYIHTYSDTHTHGFSVCVCVDVGDASKHKPSTLRGSFRILMFGFRVQETASFFGFRS